MIEFTKEQLEVMVQQGGGRGVKAQRELDRRASLESSGVSEESPTESVETPEVIEEEPKEVAETKPKVKAKRKPRAKAKSKTEESSNG